MLEYDIEKITEEDIKECYSESADIQFVGYKGYDPRCNLCSGTLMLIINGENVTFGAEGDFADFFSPGECWSNRCERKSVNSKGWNVDVKKLPMEYRPYAKQIHELLNQHMPTDFCIGCD